MRYTKKALHGYSKALTVNPDHTPSLVGMKVSFGLILRKRFVRSASCVTHVALLASSFCCSDAYLSFASLRSAFYSLSHPPLLPRRKGEGTQHDTRRPAMDTDRDVDDDGGKYDQLCAVETGATAGVSLFGLLDPPCLVSCHLFSTGLSLFSCRYGARGVVLPNISLSAIHFDSLLTYSCMCLCKSLTVRLFS